MNSHNYCWYPTGDIISHIQEHGTLPTHHSNYSINWILDEFVRVRNFITDYASYSKIMDMSHERQQHLTTTGPGNNLPFTKEYRLDMRYDRNLLWLAEGVPANNFLNIAAGNYDEPICPGYDYYD